MTWNIWPLDRSLGRHAANWDGLNERLGNGHPMLASTFVDALLSHFGDGSEQLCELNNQGELSAMCIVRRKNALVWTTFLPSQAQVGPLLLGDTRIASDLLKRLGKFVIGLDLLCVDPQLITAGPQMEDRAAGALQATTMNVDLSGGYDAYWASRPSGLRQNLRRYEKRAAAEGLAARLVTHTDANAVREAVRRYAALESKGWKATNGTALSPENVQGRFYEHVLVSLTGVERAEVHELWMGDRLAASRLVIASGGMLVMLKTTYDEDLDTHAPGRILLRIVLEYMFSRHPGKVVEFYTDATQDQLAWATSTRQIKHWTIYRSPWVKRIVRGIRCVRGTVRPPVEAPTADELRGPAVAVFDQLDQLPKEAIRFLENAEKSDLRLGAPWQQLSLSTGKRQPQHWLVLSQKQVCNAVVALHSAPANEASADTQGAFWATPVIRPRLKSRELLPLALALRDMKLAAPSYHLSLVPSLADSFDELSSAFEMAGMPTVEHRRRQDCAGRGQRPPSDAQNRRSQDDLERLLAKWTLRVSRNGREVLQACSHAAIDELVSNLTETGSDQYLRCIKSDKAQLLSAFGSGDLALGVVLCGGKICGFQWWVFSSGCAWMVCGRRDLGKADLSANRLLAARIAAAARQKIELRTVVDLAKIEIFSSSDPTDRNRELEAFCVRSSSGLAAFIRAM